MLLKLFRLIRCATGGTCPKCGSTNTSIENNIRYCYDCHYEW